MAGVRRLQTSGRAREQNPTGPRKPTADREPLNAGLGSHVASENLHHLEAFGVNEHATLTKTGKNGQLVFTN
jgi:hypothetical protein